MKRIISLGLLVFCVLLCGVLFADDWLQYRYSNQRTGSTSENLLPLASSPPLTLLWEINFPFREPVSSATVVGDRIYIGGQDAKLYCIKDGQILWTFQADREFRATPTYHKGRLYAGCLDGNLYVLNAGTGELIYKIFHGGSQISSPLIVNDIMYFGVGDPSTELRAYHALTGAFLWSVRTGQPVNSSPCYVNGVVVVGNNAGIWYAVDAQTGIEKWVFRTGSGVGLSSPCSWGNYVVLAPGDYDRYLYIVNVLTGELVKKIMPKLLADLPKPGEEPAPDYEIQDPTSLVDPLTLENLLALPKPDRDKMLDEIASVNPGIDYTPLRKWLDIQSGDAEPDIYKPGAPLSKSYDYPIRTSSPSFASGKIFITQRDITGGAGDFVTYCINVSDPEPANWTIQWTTDPLALLLVDIGYVASPAIASNFYLYIPFGTKLLVRDINGTNLGEINIGEQITASAVASNSRVIIATESGKLLCYQGQNTPPCAPDIFSPANGVNITDTNTPVINWAWSQTSDLETLPANIISQIRYALGYLNKDLELKGTTLTLPPGVTSFTFPSPVPPNTHVYYQVRARDGDGAWSGWSSIQDFWVKKDLYPPEPPSDFLAVPGDSLVSLSWSPSPSPDVMFYKIYYKQSTQIWSEASVKDKITSTSIIITGLTNGITYDFMLTAVDIGENESPGLVTSATPLAPISVNGVVYQDIQSAIDDAPDGGTVLLGTQTFYLGAPLIIGKQVSIKGVSPRYTKIVGDGAFPLMIVQKPTPLAVIDPQFQRSVSFVSLSNGSSGIIVEGGQLVVQHCVIHSMSEDAIKALADTQVQVINNTIANNGGAGIYFETSNGLIKNNIVGNNLKYGIYCPYEVSVRYNDSYANAQGNYSPTGTMEGNISEPAKFIDEIDFLVKVNSPTIDRADPADDYSLEPQPNGSRRNQGAYGNTIFAAITLPQPVLAAGGGAGGGGCYIATSALSGELNASENITTLINLRDSCLKKTATGEVFLKAYDNLGPVVAEHIQQEPIKTSVRHIIVYPLIAMTTSYGKMLLLVLTCLCLFVLIARLLKN